MQLKLALETTVIPLPLPLQCWNYRHDPTCLAGNRILLRVGCAEHVSMSPTRASLYLSMYFVTGKGSEHLPCDRLVLSVRLLWTREEKKSIMMPYSSSVVQLTHANPFPLPSVQRPHSCSTGKGGAEKWSDLAKATKQGTSEAGCEALF